VQELRDYHRSRIGGTALGETGAKVFEQLGNDVGERDTLASPQRGLDPRERLSMSLKLSQLLNGLLLFIVKTLTIIKWFIGSYRQNTHNY
jgi:hypothetical protein